MKIEFLQLDGGRAICGLPALAVYYWYVGMQSSEIFTTNSIITKSVGKSPYDKSFPDELFEYTKILCDCEIKLIEPPKFCLGLDGRLYILKNLEWQMIKSIFENNSNPLLTAYEECCLGFLYFLASKNLLKDLTVT